MLRKGGSSVCLSLLRYRREEKDERGRWLAFGAWRETECGLAVPFSWEPVDGQEAESGEPSFFAELETYSSDEGCWVEENQVTVYFFCLTYLVPKSR